MSVGELMSAVNTSNALTHARGYKLVNNERLLLLTEQVLFRYFGSRVDSTFGDGRQQGMTSQRS